MPGISGVGVSFGAERIYDVMTRLDLFPNENRIATRVLFVNFGKNEETYILPILARVRENGINAEIYPDQEKMKKQMTYAHRREIPFVVIAGETEISQRKLTLKNMATGEQMPVTTEELIKILST
jgi:histidyl-tRNA synthetase